MKYKYEGRGRNGSRTTGILESPSESTAATELMNQGITPISIKKHEEVFSLQEELNKLFQAKKVPIDELIIFFRQMNALSRAGVPLIRALKGLLESARSQALIKAIQDILGHLETGVSLASAFSKTKVFDPILVNMLNVGENTGQLDDAFAHIAKHLELEKDIKKRIKQATRYPTMVIGFISAALVIVNYFVIPSFAKIFEQFGADLPIPTQILLGVSGFFIDYKWLLLATLIGGGFALRNYINTEAGRLVWDQRKLQMPLLGPIIKKILLARFARTFAMLSAAGIPILKALTIVAQAVGNVHIEQSLMLMHGGIERGDSFTRTAAGTKLFPPLVLQMISVGEETGSLDPMLLEVATFYEEEVDYALANLSNAIEPIMLVMMGGMVLMLALGIFLPLWDLSANAAH